jgi:hypothetical protein
MRTIFSIFLVGFVLVSCSDNSKQHKAETILKQDTVKAKKLTYIHVNREWGYDGYKWDSTFYIDKSKVSVFISIAGRGRKTSIDTSFYEDTGWVYTYREQVIHIKVNSEVGHEITIDRDFMRRHMPELKFDDQMFGLTRIDSIDKDNKVIVFTTDVCSPAVRGTGLIVKYSIDLNGNVEYIRNETQCLE